MSEIKYQIVQPGDDETIQLIAEWYLGEWNIPTRKTIQKLTTLSEGDSQFQVLMTMDDVPVATGGLYNHVGLIDKEPRFGIYKNWLVLVFTKPENRHKGLGALICSYIQERSGDIGIKEIFLFTDTAENLYRRLGWQQIERLLLGDRKIVVMKKDLKDKASWNRLALHS
ncbi:MAG: GNAT family N-acetyltransferase [Ginsengibacter sp.]